MKDSSYIQEDFHSITFNPYKHHLKFLRLKTEEWKKMLWIEVEQEIKYIGNNLIDLYYGSLTVSEIYNEVSEFTKNNGLVNREQLLAWLRPLEYRKIEISDGSVWIIREGQDPNKFIHIHPGKHSPLTIRVKGPVLKSVIAMKVYGTDLEKEDLQTINHIRTELLHLSPIKRIVSGKGISRMMHNFNSL